MKIKKLLFKVIINLLLNFIENNNQLVTKAFDAFDILPLSDKHKYFCDRHYKLKQLTFENLSIDICKITIDILLVSIDHWEI